MNELDAGTGDGEVGDEDSKETVELDDEETGNPIEDPGTPLDPVNLAFFKYVFFAVFTFDTLLSAEPFPIAGEDPENLAFFI
eukprot:CAMPEP_0197823102 /NCGR_PEP_ID=MMETSP1437-20131217/436_1 /TAXON_ID=49252 ORGANISM="Eucampia antarctica, Strain CCMP1452" /NCGR_SAMPLE_ID=MMETSP1437 /ASSEMBLY_ACC=CAM_ASM_001096 /LENGTH=81 /DNA_ID=CAMNT_0043422091 /DNA_START=46 /DNA_END=291 /DNA_ORIENTATION=-